VSLEYPQPPAGVGIQLVDTGDGRLVIAVPPGGKRARGIGCFAVMWLLITVPVSMVFLGAALAGGVKGEAPPLLFLLPFFGVFYLVGFGMLLFWVRLRFTQTLLALTPEELVIQRTLLGRRKLTRTTLDGVTEARLEESYSENNVPVYRVAIQGLDRKEKFGTQLSPAEKNWLVLVINRFLNAQRGIMPGDVIPVEAGYPDRCEDCEGELFIRDDDGRECERCGRIYAAPARSELSAPSDIAPSDISGATAIADHVDDLPPEELPATSRIRIDEDDGSRLVVSYRALGSGSARTAMGCFGVVFCLIWFGVIATAAGGFLMQGGEGDLPLPVLLVMAVVFFAMGSMPLTFTAFVLSGRVSVTVDELNLTARAGVGAIGKSKVIPLESVTDIGLTSGFRRIPSGVPVRSGSSVCVVSSTGMTLPLTIGSDPQLSRELAGLIQGRLHQLGITLPGTS